MTDILFGQSYYLRFDPKLFEAMMPHPPLGSLYAAAVARRAGYEVAFFDAMLSEGEADFERALEQHKPRYVVLYEDNFNYLSKMCLLRMRQAAVVMLAAAQARGIPSLICGADASDHEGVYLDAGAKVVIRGEGEATLVEVLAALEAKADLQGVAGISFRRGETLIRNPGRPVLRDLDSLPWPAWDLADLPKYREIWRRRHGRFSINMVTTRGCPYHCNWCSKPIWGQRYGSRSASDVVRELAHLRDDFGAEHVWFADDILGLAPGWLDRFASVLEAERLVTPFKCQTRVDLMLRHDGAEALGRAGCELAWLGVESGSQKILDAMEKGTTLAQVRGATEALRAAGVAVAWFLQFGYPGETMADIDATRALVRDCVPDDIGISVAYPLPGTKFYERVAAQLGAVRHWQDSADLAMLYRGPFSTDFYRELHGVVHAEHDMALAARRVEREVRALAPRLGTGRLVVRGLRGAASLPGRLRRLRRFAAERGAGEGALPIELTPRQAAEPSPQSEA